MYDQYFITLYNIVYTSLPVLAMGVFDQVWQGVVRDPWVCEQSVTLPFMPTLWEEGLPGCLSQAVLVIPWAVVEAAPAQD